jgi:hypothetical protein
MQPDILRLSSYALIGYIVSWMYFFISLPFIVQIFGKIKGSAINYGISWIIMIVIVYILQKLKPYHNTN